MSTETEPKPGAVGTGVAGWISGWSSIQPERSFVVFEDERLSWREFEENVARQAQALLRLGVEPGDRVACMSVNTPRFIELVWATLRVGAIFCPINYRLTQPEVAQILADLEPAVCFAQRDYLPLLEQQDNAGQIVQFDDRPSAEEGPLLSLPPAPRAEDPAAILFTSGTTGRAKGAVLSHANLQAAATNWAVTLSVTSADRFLLTVPLCFTAGLICSLVPAITGGSIILHPEFDEDQMMTSVVEHQPTWTGGVPTILMRLLRHPQASSSTLGSLRFAVSGGAGMDRALVDLAEERGFQIVHGYGSTEGSGGLVIALPEAYRALRPQSVGVATPLSRVRLVDADGRVVDEPGVVGEIQMAGPLVFQGYWGNPDATRAAFSDGWYRSGDLASRDEAGIITIAGRSSELIISGGLNVYPAEVEYALSTCPGILEATVLGVPDPEWGESVAAVVALKPGAETSTAEIEAHCRERLAGYKIPRRIMIVPEIPRKPSGKANKSVLYDRFDTPTAH
jgi:fatty-acyl-CoA synthase